MRSPQATRLQQLLVGPDVLVTSAEPGLLEVAGLSEQQIGDAAAEHGIALHKLTPLEASLEQAFMELTREELKFEASKSPSQREAVA